jgi:Fe2+ transport system protein FeoA
MHRARLRELGFVRGERVEVMAAGQVAAEPLLVQSASPVLPCDAARPPVCA